ncbi:LacI family DNA-binding transcriptional regulator [Gardnerella vaginalis]|uniref:LacI family DNA-binding transcriptional regulator n=1 Tax=Gardnerella TaxID=2701 RepID=UPI0039EF79B1
MNVRRVTIKDVAEKANVSKSAVSFAYNDPSKLSEATVEHIMQTAEEMGYVRSATARALRTNSSNALGLLLPQGIDTILQNPYYSLLIQGIGQVCQSEGYTLMLVPPLRGSMLKAIPTAAVSGFIICGLEAERAEVVEILNKHVPVVIVDPAQPINVPTVEVDDEHDFEDLVDRLIDLGHRNIGIAAIETKSHTDYPGWQGIVGRRMASVVRALKKHNLSPEDKEITVIETPCTYQGGADVFNKMWNDTSLEYRPTAIVSFSDIIALGVLGAAQQQGLRVPEDLSITGYDDLPLSTICTPRLTTVHQPITSKGRLAAESLIDQIRFDEESLPVSHKKLGTALIVRESVGAAPLKK